MTDELSILMSLMGFDLAGFVLFVTVNLLLWAWVVSVPPVIVLLKRLHMGARGLALPGFIFLRSDSLADHVIRHELVHQAQMRKYSPLGAALLLGWHYTTGFIKRRRFDWATFVDLYYLNPLEIEAFQGMTSMAPLPDFIKVDFS